MKRYAVGPGRAILRFGKPFVNIQKANGVDPSSADDFTREVVSKLNAFDDLWVRAKRAENRVAEMEATQNEDNAARALVQALREVLEIR